MHRISCLLTHIASLSTLPADLRTQTPGKDVILKSFSLYQSLCRQTQEVWASSILPKWPHLYDVMYQLCHAAVCYLQFSQMLSTGNHSDVLKAANAGSFIIFPHNAFILKTQLEAHKDTLYEYGTSL